MKKFALLMAVIMLAVAAFSVSAFDDVTVEDACFDAVNTLTSLEVIKGKTETTFAPDDLVTREQMAALMSRLYTTICFENGTNESPFTDLDDPYYNSAIAWCYDAGVINGTTPSTFEPKGNIIYQDALTMACRLLGYTDLTYPLGYITKARLIGLTEDLDGVAYDKELTRGEVAILLYNTLNADGATVIKENKVKYYNGYPILEAVERNFNIALDVYNFKTETYLIVGTENFNLDGYNKAGETSFELAYVDTDSDVVSTTSTEMEFEELQLSEDLNGDDYILGYAEILYKGDELDNAKTVILSTVFSSNYDVDADISVYYKKNASNKLVAQTDKITIDGKNYKVEEKVYTVDNNGEISAIAADSLDDVKVFFQTDSAAEGKYAQKAIDVDKDGEVDYVMFFPMSLQKVTGLTAKGVYTLKPIRTNGSNQAFDTTDEDCTLIIDAEVAKNDYVLTYTYGPFTVIAETLDPVVTTVSKVTGTSNKKYTLATGDVVTFAEDNNPILGDGLTDALTVSNDEVVLYIVNDKVVYNASADSINYTPYTYAYIVSKGDDETSVDTEDGTIETVHNLIAFMNGKAVTIPTSEDYASDANWASYEKKLVTVIKIKDGKYVLESGAKMKDAYDSSKQEGYEIDVAGGTLTYDKYSKTYKITSGSKSYTTLLDANSEFYVQTNKNGKYDSIKRYTMANTPTTSLDSVSLSDGIIRVNYVNEKPSSYTLVVAIAIDNDGTFATSTDYTNYRIVLESGLTLDKNGMSYAAYEVLNPVTGAVESIVDDSVETDSVANITGAIVVQKSNGAVSVQSAVNEAFSSSDVNRKIGLIQVADGGIINDGALATFYKSKNSNDILTGSTGSELVLGSCKVVVLSYNDDDELEVEVTDDYDEMDGKVCRIYTNYDMSLKAYYIVVVPYEWAKDAGFTNLEAYDEYDPADFNA